MKHKHLLTLVLIISAIVFTTIAAQIPSVSSAAASEDDSLIMHINSPLVLSKGEVARLDSSNADVVPMLVNDHTLVPLKAVAEHFNATVDYDSIAQTAIIIKDGVRYIFPIGEKYYLIDGKEKVNLDVATTIVRQRTMLPLRAIAEQIFEKKVSYYDQIIVIGNKSVDLAADKQTCETIKDKIAQALHPQTLTELKNYIAMAGDNAYNDDVKALTTDAGGSARQESSANEPTSDEQDSYSLTNTQVEGIDEADIVKTDGQYLYIVAGQDVVIVEADGSNMREVSRIKGQENVYINDLFIDNGRLVLMGNRYEYQETNDVIAYDGQEKVSSLYYNSGCNYVYTAVYDTTDKSSPQLLKEVEAEGSLVNSRKNGDYVYIVASQYYYWRMYAGAEDDQILPMVKDSSVDDEPMPISLNDLMICPQQDFDCYTTVIAINIRDTEVEAEFESFAGSAQEIYMNDSSLFLTFYDYDWQDNTTKTGLISLDVNQTNINYRAGGAVKGYLLNQYSMDEYDGYFRIATTTNDSGCNLYVLDQQLNEVGSISNLAEGESIYAVRFSGERGYLVTYETIDPLFTLDLSDPTNPLVAGELKLPGFSNYLHVIDENTLLGIGRDTQEMYARNYDGNETFIGMRSGGIKLSLFDVSDYNNPQVINEYVIGGAGSYTEALYNHKALMVDSDQGIFGFCATLVADGQDYQQYFTGALLFKVSNDSISPQGEISYNQPTGDDENYQYYQRLAYIGDTIYYLQDGLIRAFDNSSLEELASISV